MGKYPYIRILVHDKPKGIGASFWEGLAWLRRIGDASARDAENDSYEILRYIPLMDHVDIIVPFIYRKNVRSWQRRLISKAYKASSTCHLECC